LADSESRTVEDDGSALSVEASDKGPWLVYQSSQPATLRELRLRAEPGCLTLARLVLDHDVVTGARQVQAGWLADPYCAAVNADLLPGVAWGMERSWFVLAISGG